MAGRWHLARLTRRIRLGEHFGRSDATLTWCVRRFESSRRSCSSATLASPGAVPMTGPRQRHGHDLLGPDAEPDRADPRSLRRGDGDLRRGALRRHRGSGAADRRGGRQVAGRRVLVPVARRGRVPRSAGSARHAARRRARPRRRGLPRRRRQLGRILGTQAGARLQPRGHRRGRASRLGARSRASRSGRVASASRPRTHRSRTS